MNSSSWDRFRREQAGEREQLRRLLAGMRPLLIQCRRISPSEIELSALAALLHAFYTGIENIFKRLALELDGTTLSGEAWHRDLLRTIEPTEPDTPSASAGRFAGHLQ